MLKLNVTLNFSDHLEVRVTKCYYSHCEPNVESFENKEKQPQLEIENFRKENEKLVQQS